MDQLAIELVKPVVKKSWKEIMLAKDLDSEMKALKEKRDLIDAAHADANSLGSCSSRTQQITLDKLVRARERIDDFLEKRATRAEQRKVSGGGLLTKVRLLFSSNPLLFRFKDAREFKVIGKEIDLILNDNATFGTVVNMVYEEKKIQLPTGPFPNTDFIGGRDVERNDLVAKLCHSSNDQESLGLSTVAIVGIGGQGKSTLAQYVYNDPRVIDYFGVRLWVYATPNIGLEDLLKNIIAHATDEKPPSDCTMSQLHDRLVKAIRGKKFLLVLDNIWDQDKLKENWDQLRILLLHGDSGSKVLVTTRSKEVARIMGSPDPYVLNGLTNETAWHLFQHFAFTLRPESRLEAIGKEIFKMCPKIPLVLKVVGQHLSAECHTIYQWRAVKDALAKKSSYKGKDMIMETLKLSYDLLHEKLKPCVVYCSLFPKGMIYDVDKMIRLWIALGYVKAGDKSLEDVGQEYVQMLANLVFFQHVVEDEFSNIIKFKMHDVIHDLMLSESKSQHKMVDSETTEIEENICHVSFLWTRTRYEFDWDTRSSSSTSKQPLKSILMVKSDSNCLSGFGQTFGFRSGYDELIRRFQGLKVLDVHGLGISEVPASLGKLIYLRYLDLSENKMDRLPKSITQLVNLFSLDLSHCYNLKELPNDISKLYKLRYLQLYKCINLTYMPKGLGKLKDLQNLDWFIVGHVNGDVMGGLDELSDLVNLKGRLIITMAVESKYIVSQGRIAPLGRKDKLTELEIQFEKGAKEDEMVLEGLRPQGEKLMRMNIFGYGGKNLPSWMMNEQLHFDLPNLLLIWMTNANACAHYMLKKKKRMLASECGPWLQIDLDNDNLLLESMPGFIDLKKQLTMNVVEVGFDKPDGVGSRGLILRKLRISEQLAASQSFQQRRNRIFFKTWFPKLRLLMIDRIPELEVLPEEFRGLSFLETLEFCDCPKLKALPDWLGTLTSLKRIRLQNCPEFETIPHQISNLSQLVKLYIGPLLSEVLVERCRKPTGELWPSIQHIDSIHMSYYAGDRNRRHTFTYSRNEQ